AIQPSALRRINENVTAELSSGFHRKSEPSGESGRFLPARIDVAFATATTSINSTGALPIYDGDVVEAARSLMLISDVSVRCTGHFAAISISFACCASLKDPVSSTSTS